MEVFLDLTLREVDSYGRYVFLRLQKIYLGDDYSKKFGTDKALRQRLYYTNIFDHNYTADVDELELANWYTYSDDAPFMMKNLDNKEGNCYDPDEKLDAKFSNEIKWSMIGMRQIKAVKKTIFNKFNRQQTKRAEEKSKKLEAKKKKEAEVTKYQQEKD